MTNQFLPVLSRGFANHNQIVKEPNRFVPLKSKGSAVIGVRYYAGRKRYEVSSEGVLCWYSTDLKSLVGDFNMAAKLI